VKQSDDDLTDLEIDPAPEEHRRTYEHASLGLADDRPAPPAGGVASEGAPPPPPLRG
jgi:hypothetical protein